MHLTQSQINQVNQAFLDLHNFFAKKHTLYVFKEKTITHITEDPDYNAFFSSFDNHNIQTETETGSFHARVYYSRNDIEGIETKGNLETSASLPLGWIRIITDDDGAAVLGDTNKIKIKDQLHSVSTLPGHHGLIKNQFHDYYLSPEN